MAAKRKQYILSTTGKNKNDLLKEYNRLVKTANKRISIITKPKNISGAQAYRYNVEAMAGAPFIKSKGDIYQFATLKKSTTAMNIRTAINEIYAFLGAKTSTVGGIKEVEAQRISQIQEVYKNFKSPDFPDGILPELAREIAIFLGSDKGVEAKRTYDSKDIVVAMAVSNKLSKGARSVLDSFLEFEKSGKEFGQWQRENEELLKSGMHKLE